MPTILTCALLSDDAYRDSGSNVVGYRPVELPTSAHLLNDATSFFARAYFAGDTGVVAIRGSAEVEDWSVANKHIALGFLPFGQLRNAFRYFEAARRRLGELGATRFVVTGHSLGGGLAEAVAARVTEVPVNAATFNAPGLIGFSRVVDDSSLNWGIAMSVVTSVMTRVIVEVPVPTKARVTVETPVCQTPKTIVNVRSSDDRISRHGTHTGSTRIIEGAGFHWLEPLVDALVDHPVGRERV